MTHWCGVLGAALWLAACSDLNRPSSGGGGGFLADRYPCDQGIGNDPQVVWHEDFEAGSVPAVTARYNEYQNTSGMALVADKPSASCGAASMRLTSGGSVSATDLYKKPLKPDGSGYDELFVRWYVKYQAGAPWHHSGVWFGGYNPPTDWPNPQAGTRPVGDDRVSIAMEPIWGVGSPNPRFDFYDYWMTMHTCSSCAGAYWGNALVSRNAFTADDDQWACVEVHAMLNTDVASAAGAELEVWKNDVLVQHFPETGGAGAGAIGDWVQDHYCPAGADGAQCNYSPTAPGPLGLQFRSSAALQLNHLWLQNYITDTSTGSVWFDDVVVATTRIGCLR
ncbi:MAG TPA: hypothetical protein VFD73_00260 [Gemmatimonadales bacterium]|nr:hypothetical protein [Gemmatimonadales bacterium]